MADVAFDVQYDGPILRSHEMDVRSLAPSLLALADLFQEMNQVRHPFSPAVTVNVRATAEGSFLVELSLGYNKVTDLLSGDNVTAAANLSGLLSVTGGLLIYTVKKWRSRVKKSAPLAEPVDGRPAVRIEFEDGSSIEIPTEVVDLDRNIAVRKSLNELVRPLHADGIEQLRMRREEITIAQVEAADVEAFEVTELEDRREVLVSNERNEYLTILNLAFQAGNKWRLSDGRSAFYATMRDAQFLQLVERGERFSKHDVLHCHIRQTQWRDDEGLHSDTEVIRVLQHLPHNPNAQGALFEGE